MSLRTRPQKRNRKAALPCSESLSQTTNQAGREPRRPTTEPDLVAPVLSHCSSLKPRSAFSSRFLPVLKLDTQKFVRSFHVGLPPAERGVDERPLRSHSFTCLSFPSVPSFGPAKSSSRSNAAGR